MPPSNRTPTRKDAPDSGPTHIVKRMIALVNELIQVMESEVALIEGRKLTEHAELLKRKQRLAIDYRASVKSLSAQPDILRQVPDDLRKKARDAVQRLTEASERNAKILRGAITALQRLVQTIISIVKEEVLPKGSYRNPGVNGRVAQSYSPTCKPVAVSQTA